MKTDFRPIFSFTEISIFRYVTSSVLRSLNQSTSSASYTVHCVRATDPAYFQQVCLPVVDVTGQSHLRSAERRDMLVPRIRTQFGRRSFHAAAPVVWNSLPAWLRSASISCGQFRDGLKTHLFL